MLRCFMVEIGTRGSARRHLRAFARSILHHVEAPGGREAHPRLYLFAVRASAAAAPIFPCKMVTTATPPPPPPPPPTPPPHKPPPPPPPYSWGPGGRW